MNAKKIMGAVLVALLAAALFVGAGAAAPASGTVFINQALPADYNVAWVGGNGVVTPSFDGTNYYFPAGSEGVYTYEVGTAKYTITVKSPELFASGIAGSGAAKSVYIPAKSFFAKSSAPKAPVQTAPKSTPAASAVCWSVRLSPT